MRRLCVSVMVLFFSCASAVPIYDANISVERYFRYAQDARNRSNPGLAIEYYKLIIKNFEQRPDKILIAEYEMGVIFYRKKDYKKALALFDKVMAGLADARVGNAVPPAVAQLTQQLKEEVESKMNGQK